MYTGCKLGFSLSKPDPINVFPPNGLTSSQTASPTTCQVFSSKVYGNTSHSNHYNNEGVNILQITIIDKVFCSLFHQVSSFQYYHLLSTYKMAEK